MSPDGRRVVRRDRRSGGGRIRWHAAHGVGRRSQQESERGSGTVLVVALMAVVVMLMGMLTLMVGAQVAHGRAQAAADLAALAAADAITAPRDVVVDEGALAGADPCRRAGDVAARNAAEVSTCTVLPDGVVQVVVSVRGISGVASARARAGPAWARG